MIPSWETLNAYVDGELTTVEAATVARALAEDRVLAGRAASLTRLKAAVQESVEAIEIALPRPSRPSWRPLALAASVVLAFVIGVLVAQVPWQGPAQPPWLADARAVHTAWIASDQAETAVDGGLMLATMHKAGPGAYLPDLSPSKLRLSRLEPVRLPGRERPALHVGYRGTRGCQVSLLIVPAAAGDTPFPRDLTLHDAGPSHGYVWRTRSHGYLLIATGMDEARLDLIARTVQRASLEHSPFGQETRTALRESRERSVPCRG